jgi:hypothetical protein
MDVISTRTKLLVTYGDLHLRNSCLSCQSTLASKVNKDREFGLRDATFEDMSIFNN